MCWGKLISQSHSVFYGDHDAARASMIAGRAATVVSSHLVESFVSREMELQIKPWLARVPTLSNIADDPSRLSEDAVIALGSVKSLVDWSEIETSMDHFVHS